MTGQGGGDRGPGGAAAGRDQGAHNEQGACPVTGLVIAAFALKEGRGAWRGEGCCGPTGFAGAHGHACSGGEEGGDGCSRGCCAPADAGDLGAAAMPQTLTIDPRPTSREVS